MSSQSSRRIAPEAADRRAVHGTTAGSGLLSVARTTIVAVFPAALLIACSVPEVDAKAEACIEQVAGMTGQAEDAGTASQIRSDLSGATTYSVSMANSAYTCQVGPNGEVLSVQSM